MRREMASYVRYYARRLAGDSYLMDDGSSPGVPTQHARCVVEYEEVFRGYINLQMVGRRQNVAASACKLGDAFLHLPLDALCAALHGRPNVDAAQESQPPTHLCLDCGYVGCGQRFQWVEEVNAEIGQPRQETSNCALE